MIRFRIDVFLNSCFIFAVFFLGGGSQAQIQKIAYIDTQYILDQLPEYDAALETLRKKVDGWDEEIRKQVEYIERLKVNLAADKLFLAGKALEDRKKELSENEAQLSELKKKYFGKDGLLLTEKSKVIKPIQDQIWNAVNDLAKKKRYSFVFDKSSILMLYADRTYDLSDKVLRVIKNLN